MALQEIKSRDGELHRLIVQIRDSPDISLKPVAFDGLDGPGDTLHDGARLGAYRLLREVGRGGMGSVWLGERADGLYSGRVAIKLLNAPLLRDIGSRDRFVREGEILARMTHPNIARLLDAGTSAQGARYLVLEYIDGVTINNYCEQRKLGPEQRIELFMQALDAVAHAHAQLILHRDIKPGNILVTDDGQVKLLDFGLGKLLSDELDSVPDNLTRVAGIGYTPRYASKEQMTGGAMTTASDVYSLGVTLYELITGASFDPAAAYTRPSERLTATTERTGWTRLVRGDLDSIIAKALSEEPAERYINASAFKDDLQRFLRSEPVTAQPDTRMYRARKFVRRHRIAVGSSALVTMLIIASLAFSLYQWNEARHERDEARFQERMANTQADVISVMYDQLVEGDSRESNLARVARAHAMVRDWKAMDPVTRGAVYNEIAIRYHALGELPQAMALLQQSRDEVAPFVATSRHALNIDFVARCNLAAQKSERTPAEGVTLIGAALDEVAKTALLTEETQVNCFMAGEAAYRRGGDETKARQYSERMWQLVQTTPDERMHYSLQAEAMSRRAQDAVRSGRYREAITLFGSALESLASHGQADTLAGHNFELLRAESALSGGNTALADDFINKRLKAGPAIRPDQQRTPRSLALLTRRALIDADFASAATLAQQSVAATTEKGSLSNHIFAWAYLAIARTHLGDLAGARAALAEAKQNATASKLESLHARNALAESLIALAAGDAQAAYAAQSRYLPERVTGNPRFWHFAAWVVAARAQLALGDTTASLALCDRVLAEAEPTAFNLEASLWVAQAEHCRAAALDKSGRGADAEAASKRALMNFQKTLPITHPVLRDATLLVPRL